MVTSGSRGVDLGLPDPPHRQSAYFRHRFRTEREHRDLLLLCYRDDGIIVYLDGEEVARDNMDPGKEAYELSASRVVSGSVTGDNDPVGEQELAAIQLAGILPAGDHVLAISLHNRNQVESTSSDLRLGGVRLLSALPELAEE